MKKTLFLVALCVSASGAVVAQCNCSGASSSVSTGEQISSLLTLPKNSWLAEIHGEFRAFAPMTHDHSAHHHNGSADTAMTELNRMVMGLAGLRFGISERITLGVQLPYIMLDADPAGSSGIGDLLATGMFRIYSRKNFAAGVLAGAELPTGIHATVSGDNSLVIGSGSFDPVAGLTLTHARPRSFARGSVIYKQGLNGFENINFGNFLAHTVTWGYRLKGSDPSCSADSTAAATAGFSWQVFAALQGEWYGHQVQNGAALENTGGNMHLLQAGTQFGLKGWSVPVIISFPLLQNLDGEQSSTRFRARIGVTKTF